jgi:hypothetical protein
MHEQQLQIQRSEVTTEVSNRKLCAYEIAPVSVCNLLGGASERRSMRSSFSLGNKQVPLIYS